MPKLLLSVCGQAVNSSGQNYPSLYTIFAHVLQKSQYLFPLSLFYSHVFPNDFTSFSSYYSGISNLFFTTYSHFPQTLITKTTTYK